MRAYVGTSGYSYPEWRGGFYPSDLRGRDMLRYFSDRLLAVEINNTFYRMPKAEVLRAWAGTVPSAFRFALKAPRRITHSRWQEETAGALGYFFATASVLGDKSGPVLMQLPPYARCDLARLDRLVDAIPPGWPVAFEFRHPSWFVDEVRGRLARRNFALCVADTEEQPAALASITPGTADWGYLRLRRVDYTPRQIDAWAQRLRGLGWRDAWVFFKHEQAARAPRYAAQLVDALGCIVARSLSEK